MKRPSTEPPSIRQIAKQFGISRAVLWRAQQVAHIPAEEFERLIESDNPPTVTQMVEIGRSHGGRPRLKWSRALTSLKRAWAAATPEERAEFVAHVLSYDGERR
ncbi:hypothetical protein BjapCC829_28155 [Bradyrhizobium barranii]|jgi:hypothetical protein|uniref:Uncharacterized protein n=2 Tax=Bradyrhizobium TaxID=374 RepID=A0ABY3QCZ6_9BRAD|nr:MULTISPECIES: hypothetical protein [Bradyrhizobium]UFW83819.1 hypothetical protein BjapCC829_28155 [Bradyrhizobium japonicum]